MLAIIQENCLRCGGCVPICPTEALVLLASGITCDHDHCVVCGDCTFFCPVRALELADA
ncbi:ferredoxin [candidate division GN15 bacterium]|nr:ferredoxin [candidate division GN15 bacterium]